MTEEDTDVREETRSIRQRRKSTRLKVNILVEMDLKNCLDEWRATFGGCALLESQTVAHSV
jgi:hypothetical protein